MTKRRRGRARTPGVAQLTIRMALDAYAAAQPAERRRHARSDLGLLEGFLNGYAYESLPSAERDLFDRLFNAKGAAHREYCEIFGPEKIGPELRMFLGWFMIRKVMARAEDLTRVAAEVEQFIAWLEAQGYIGREAAVAGAALAAEGREVLPRAEEVARLIYRQIEAHPAEDAAEVIDGYFTVVRLAPGKVWLESDADGETYGPLAVPAEVTERVDEGWQVSGAVGRVGQKWALVEVWNVYPEVG